VLLSVVTNDNKARECIVKDANQKYPRGVKAPRSKRVRRTPEEARALILDAAERVFAERLPDVAGLKDIATEAGVSHALVTHYFGTYEKLVEATLERRFGVVRERIVAELMATIASTTDASTILAAYRRAIGGVAADPVSVRLVVWAFLSGRAAAEDFFSHRVQGLKHLADAIEARASLPREDLEFALVASFAMTVMWKLGGDVMAGALGKRSRRELHARIDAQTTEMIDAYLQRIAR
jgi:TetR/AcrR family transcriptional regulator, repressor for neighboring sulfatase